MFMVVWPQPRMKVYFQSKRNMKTVLVTRRKEEIPLEQLLPFIQDYGFPVVVTFYLLHRIEAKLDTLNQSILQLPEKMGSQE